MTEKNDEVKLVVVAEETIGETSLVKRTMSYHTYTNPKVGIVAFPLEYVTKALGYEDTGRGLNDAKELVTSVKTRFGVIPRIVKIPASSLKPDKGAK